MNRKILAVFGVVLLAVAFTSCSSNPEKGLLDRYFNALSLNDLTTLSTMAIDPVSIEFDSWELVSVSEEIVEPAKLPEMNQKELDLKKQQEESVGVTLDARAELDDAVFERDNARGSAAKRQLQAKVDELQTKYDEQYAAHQQLQKDYNEAKAAAAREEEISLFSLGGDYSTVREFVGNVHTKTVEVKIEKDGVESHYRFHLRRYMLKDEAMNLDHRGRWSIVKIERY
jgi:hypothetical protein